MVSHVAPGRWLGRFPRWLKSAVTGERRCRVEQSAGGQCEMAKRMGRRSSALLRLGATGDNGEGALTWGGERNWGRRVGQWVAQSERWPGVCAEEIPQVGLGPHPAGPDS
jgi:hypothetical protein